MSRLEIPKYEINTREAIRNTLVKGICNTVGKLPNGAFVNFDEIVNNLGIESLPYLGLKHQAVSEAKLRLSKILTYVDNVAIVDRNHVEREQIEAIHLRNRAMQKIKETMGQMKQQNLAITEESILEHLTQQDERNRDRYATWLKVFWTQGMLEEKTDKEDEREV